MKKLLLILAIITAAWSGWGQNSITQGGSKVYTVQMNVGEPSGATYSWDVSPMGGTSTDLTVITGNTATIIWDGPTGIYSIIVQVTDGNGCLSETISQDMEILGPGEVIFASALPNTQTCSDLMGNIEGSVPGHSQSLFRITYDGDASLTSAKVTVKNPDGDFIDLDGTVLTDQENPEITVNNDAQDKTIDVAVTDSWENTTTGNAVFEISLLSALTSDSSEIKSDPANDVERSITILPKPVILFE